MKKTAILAAALLFLTAACGKKESAPAADQAASAESAAAAASEPLTDDQRLLLLIEQNSITNSLKNHMSYTLNRTISSQDQEIGNEYWYAEQNIFFYESSDKQAMYVTVNEYVLTIPEEPGTVGAILANPAGVYTEWLEQVKISNSFVLAESETVTGTEERDGHIIFNTVTTDNTVIKDLYEYFSKSYGGPEYQDGIKTSCRYEFDSESSDLVSIENVFTDSDGNKMLSVKDTYSFTGFFTPNHEDGVLADWLNYSNLRTIEITFNAGTDQAVTKEFRIPKGVSFSVYSTDNYAENVYLDEACTTPLEESDRESDLVLYVK